MTDWTRTSREEREEAIAYIKLYRRLDENLHNSSPKDSVSYHATDKCLKYWDMAIQALSQEPCTDAVSRAELLKAIDTWDKFGYTETGCFVREPKGDYVTYIHYDDVIKCIKGMPSVTQKSGHWIIDSWLWSCDKCGKTYHKDNARTFKFCPNCGARMDKEQTEWGG